MGQINRCILIISLLFLPIFASAGITVAFNVLKNDEVMYYPNDDFIFNASERFENNNIICANSMEINSPAVIKGTLCWKTSLTINNEIMDNTYGQNDSPWYGNENCAALCKDSA